MSGVHGETGKLKLEVRRKRIGRRRSLREKEGVTRARKGGWSNKEGTGSKVDEQ